MWSPFFDLGFVTPFFWHFKSSSGHHRSPNPTLETTFCCNYPANMKALTSAWREYNLLAKLLVSILGWYLLIKSPKQNLMAPSVNFWGQFLNLGVWIPKGRIPLPHRMNFWTSAKGGGGDFQSKKLYCRIWEL